MGMVMWHETLDEGQWMTLIFDIHRRLCTHLVELIYQLWYHKTTIVSEKSIMLPFPHTKAQGTKFDLAVK